MGKQDALAKFLREIQMAGVEIGRACVVTKGVFFSSSRSARIFAKKHDRELVRVDGQVSGWLVKNKPTKPSV